MLVLCSYSLAALSLSVARAHAQRVKDLSMVQGVRNNQLIGYGLVVGLDGTGDQTTQTPFTTQSLLSMLNQLGVTLPPGINLQLKNVAAVMVTATLPPFAREGQPIDVVVSSLGNAKSLRGGTLLLTPLRGADSHVYAVAQGNLVVPGAGASAAGSSVQVNTLNAGRIPAGATVERERAHRGRAGRVRVPGDESGRLHHRHAYRRGGQRGVRRRDGDCSRRTADSRACAARHHSARGLPVAPREHRRAAGRGAAQGDHQRTHRLGGADADGARERVRGFARQPVDQHSARTAGVAAAALRDKGETVVTEEAQIQVQEQTSKVLLIPASASLSDVVKALNAVGATPSDLLAILQAMKAAGALKADLEVI